jgi:hypothetical protein
MTCPNPPRNAEPLYSGSSILSFAVRWKVKEAREKGRWWREAVAVAAAVAMAEAGAVAEAEAVAGAVGSVVLGVVGGMVGFQ